MNDNMNDRELLELAAKAYLDKSWHGNEAYMRGFMSTWNPLADDGDALRLAVKLGMVIDARYTQQEAFRYNRVTFWSTPSRGEHISFEDVEMEPLAATRRAIVRAAAEIGRQM